MGAYEGNENYFLARLPIGDADTPDEPAKAMIKRSFGAFRARQAGKAEWIEGRVEAALERRTELAPNEEQTWLERVASSAGLPFDIVASLTGLIDAGAFVGNTADCLKALFGWVQKNPAWLLQLLRPRNRGRISSDPVPSADRAA
jgi:hypothetical protein